MEPDHNEYLWDKTGTPDAEMQEWERLLGRFSRVEAPELVLASRDVRHSTRWRYSIAAVACLLLAGVVGLFLAWRPSRNWNVVAVDGTPRIDQRAIGRGWTGPDGLLETDQRSRARLRLGLTGAIEVQPNSKVQLIAADGRRRRITLLNGRIAARLWAPPRTLAVVTPSATAIDLGCAFEVQVDESGSGLLRVTSGWVQFQLGDRQAIVPAGAIALTRPGTGPGTPFFEDASSSFRSALERLDFGGSNYQEAAALQMVLSEARPKDVITLLSLFRRLSPDARGTVYDRASALVAPPHGYSREDARHGSNQPGIDAWWRKLGLGDAKNWLVNWRDVFTPVR